jgi:hypothetical protein
MAVIGSNNSTVVKRPEGKGQKVTALKPARGKIALVGLAPLIRGGVWASPPPSAVLVKTFAPDARERLLTAIAVPVGGHNVITFAPTVAVTGPGIEQTAVGLLYEDDFASAISADWDAIAGSFAWNSGQARGTASATLGLKASVVAARTKSYQQCLITRVSGTAEAAWYGRRNTDIDGYYIGSREGDTQLWRVNNSVYTNLDNVGIGNPDGQQVRYNMYLADGDQRTWRNGTVRAVETDTALDGGIGQPAFWARGPGGSTDDYDDFIYMTDKVLVVTGLDSGSGQRAKIRGSTGLTLAAATEVTGTATIELGGLEVPLGGWPTLLITDDKGFEIDRWDSADGGFVGVYPGDTYDFPSGTPPADTPGSDPTYPTVTGTQELKLEADGLPAALDDGDDLTLWTDDWSAIAFSVASGNGIYEGVIFDDEGAFLIDGSQSAALLGDRGTFLGAPAGLTIFIVLRTGLLSVAQTSHATMFQSWKTGPNNHQSLVARRNAGSKRLAWWDQGAGWKETTTTLADDTKYIISFRSDNTSLKVAVNGGAEEAIGNPVHQDLELYSFGSNRNASEVFKGQVAAVIYYVSELSDADRILVRNYLNTKYAIY